MSHEKGKTESSGRSFLAPDVDETIGDSTRRNVQGEETAARGRGKDEQQSHPRESATKPRPAAPPQSEPNIVRC